MKKVALVLFSVALMAIQVPAAIAAPCYGYCPPNANAGVATGQGQLIVSYLDGTPGSAVRKASSTPPQALPYQWRLRTPCQIDDVDLGGCEPGLQQCPTPPEGIVTLYEVQRQRLVQADRSAVDGVVPGSALPVGTGYGTWVNEGISCVDVTDLNPPPSPDEVFRYFQTLPLPELATQQQPPGNGLVGLPVIFFTTNPTTQTFTVDIRGFDVDITARATTFTWHTGDGTTLTTTDPGAPYPRQTITHDYRAGTYTAFLTTTWGATYSIDGGASADVPGTTTTDGPPVTFAVLQARTVLTDPYD